MGEIFQRPLPQVGLPFTGERLTSECSGQTEIEHLHRYMLARHLCRGRHVLDIASGEGYGAAMLAQVAASVIGVEVAGDVVAHAQASYQRDNLSFLQGDARAIPVADATVDTVISFETIEHFRDHERFLAEIRRVLRPGGLLCISTPDRDNYSPADRPANPYHALELTCQEFVSLLGRHFGHLSMWWQRPMIGSVMLPGPETAPAQGGLCFERRGDLHFEESSGFARPLYLVALCSDAPLPTLQLSVYIDTTFLHVRDEQARALLAAEQEKLRASEAATAAIRETLEQQRAEAERVAALLAAAQEKARIEADRHARKLRASESAAAAIRETLEQERAEAERVRALLAAEQEKARVEADRYARKLQGSETAIRETLEQGRAEAESVRALLAAEQKKARVELQGCEAAAATIRASLEQERVETERLRSAVRDLEGELDAMRGSTSWTATAPLRAITKRLRRQSG